jgi:type VI secretion system protein ImpB
MAITDEIPKSRLTLTYRTEVHGQKEDVQLPFRLLILGDLSNGKSKDRKADLDQRFIRHLDGKNLNQVMNDMDLSVTVTVPNKVDPDKAAELTATIPIKGMRSFTPAEVAQNVPKIKSLLLLKKLLLEVQANIDNRKEFRQLLRELAQHPEATEELIKELQGFEAFKVPARSNGEEPATA